MVMGICHCYLARTFNFKKGHIIGNKVLTLTLFHDIQIQAP